ncbi:hypothetical protein [Microbulbifer agarilyticus]
MKSKKRATVDKKGAKSRDKNEDRASGAITSTGTLREEEIFRQLFRRHTS